MRREKQRQAGKETEKKARAGHSGRTKTKVLGCSHQLLCVPKGVPLVPLFAKLPCLGPASPHLTSCPSSMVASYPPTDPAQATACPRNPQGWNTPTAPFLLHRKVPQCVCNPTRSQRAHLLSFWAAAGSAHTRRHDFSHFEKGTLSPLWFTQGHQQTRNELASCMLTFQLHPLS